MCLFVVSGYLTEFGERGEPRGPRWLTRGWRAGGGVVVAGALGVLLVERGRAVSKKTAVEEVQNAKKKYRVWGKWEAGPFQAGHGRRHGIVRIQSARAREVSSTSIRRSLTNGKSNIQIASCRDGGARRLRWCVPRKSVFLRCTPCRRWRAAAAADTARETTESKGATEEGKKRTAGCCCCF